ncbi:MAG TPA: SDR family oxidoreductase [Thermoanaerobaculia bacterium]|nr:SDR family oxidoreductase [Thermoanaerobaculia bacterium]
MRVMLTAAPLDLAGKVALVTGASRGIGRATAQLLAARGATLAVHYQSRREAAEETLALLAGTGHASFAADLAREDEVAALVPAVVTRLSGVDILINNAAIYEAHPPATASAEQWRAAWRRTLAIDLLAPAHLCHAAVATMRQRGGGRIVNVSSRGAFRGEPDAPAYGAAKAGLNAMSQSLARALAPHGIFVFVVAPGWVETDMAEPYLAGPGGDEIRAQSPLGRAARPEEIAMTIAFLAGPGTDYLTGCIVDANGASYLRS